MLTGLELINHISNTGFNINLAINIKGIFGIIFAIFAFGVLILVHELGHFIAAKKSNVKVLEFSIGMGPALFKRKKGETTYSIRALPFGGYVAMEGEDEDSQDDRSFRKASIPKRAVIMSAGAIVNIVFGFLIILGITVYQAAQPNIGFPTTTVRGFHETAVTNEFLKEGDQIVRVNDKKIKNYNDMYYYLSRDDDGLIDITVVRNGQELVLENVKFDRQEVAEGLYYNVLDFTTTGIKPTVLGTIQRSFDITKDLMRQIWMSLIELLTGNVSVKHMSGPVGITQQIGEISSSGDWLTTLLFVALISLNLGIFNLIPFPVLDGGKIFLLILEGVRGKPISQKVEVGITLAGIVLLFGLMIVVTFNDILKLF